MAQFVMVDQVLTKRDADDPLRHQRLHTVLDEVAVAAVLEAGGEAAGQSNDAIGAPSSNAPASVLTRPPSRGDD